MRTDASGRSRVSGRGPQGGGARWRRRERWGIIFDMFLRSFLTRVSGGPRAVLLALLLALSAVPALATAPTTTGNPWTTMVNNMAAAFTGPIGRGLSLVSIVVTGLMFAFGEPGGKKALAGVGFGLAMVVGAVAWLDWLTT